MLKGRLRRAPVGGRTLTETLVAEVHVQEEGSMSRGGKV